MNNYIAHKFVSYEVPELDTLKESKPYQLREKINNGQKLTREEKNYLFHSMRSCTYSKQGIALSGWMFGFGDILKHYAIKTTWGDLYEVYAPDKIAIRNSYYTNHGIAKIYELEG